MDTGAAGIQTLEEPLIMKRTRLILLSLLVLSALCLAACSTLDTNAPATTSTPAAPAATVQPLPTDMGTLATEMPAATSSPSEMPEAQTGAELP